jgi:hypothetical protein
MANKRAIPRIQYRCTFCGKSQEQVQRLIAGPGGVYICNECINMCREIIEEEQAGAPSPKPPLAESAVPGGTVSHPAYDRLARDHPEVARACSALYEAILGPGGGTGFYEQCLCSCTSVPSCVRCRTGYL